MSRSVVEKINTGTTGVRLGDRFMFNQRIALIAFVAFSASGCGMKNFSFENVPEKKAALTDPGNGNTENPSKGPENPTNNSAPSNPTIDPSSSSSTSAASSSSSTSSSSSSSLSSS